MDNYWDEAAKKAWGAILDKVNYLVKQKGNTMDAVAKIVGVGGRSVIHAWLNGTRAAENTSFANMFSYMERLGIDYRQFLPDGKVAIRRIEPNAPTELVDENEFSTIPVYAMAGAGPGILPEQLTPLFKVTAPPDYLRRSTFAIMVDGHSMEPLIPNGAIVGIREDAEFRANELYLANVPYEGLVIKRIAVDMTTKEFVFKSQNPDKESYPDFRLSIGAAEKIIIGRVVWVMIGY